MNQAFIHRVERALRFTSLKEQEKQRDIVTIEERITFFRGRVLSLEDTTRQSIVRMQQDPAWAPFAAGGVGLYLREVQKLKEMILQEQGHLGLAKKELLVLIEKRKALESLLEKKRHEWRSYLRKKNQKKLDESFQNIRRVIPVKS